MRKADVTGLLADELVGDAACMQKLRDRVLQLAGCDVNVFRGKYPTLGMMGGIDKRALAAGAEAIDRDLERVAPAVAAGRYIPDLDHGIPDDVSYENYCYYARRLKELVGKE